jgi:hypothetical protein
MQIVHSGADGRYSPSALEAQSWRRAKLVGSRAQSRKHIQEVQPGCLDRDFNLSLHGGAPFNVHKVQRIKQAGLAGHEAARLARQPRWAAQPSARGGWLLPSQPGNLPLAASQLHLRFGGSGQALLGHQGRPAGVFAQRESDRCAPEFRMLVS